MKNIISALLLFFTLYTQAQIRQEYVIASLGGTTQTPQGGATYTVGEMSMIKMFSNGNNTLTQGFLQGKIPPSISSGVDLPVKLLEFSGYYKADANHLQWVTASEQNNRYFDVERMTANGDFASIGRVAGSGTSVEEHAYTLDDNSPVPGDNYYRLKQVDIDGNYAYSNIIAISSPVTEDMTVTIYPNPAHNFVNVLFSSSDAHTGTIVMTNMIGEVVYERYVMLSSGTNQSTIDMSAFAQGQYVIKFTSSTSTTTCKIVKQ